MGKEVNLDEYCKKLLCILISVVIFAAIPINAYSAGLTNTSHVQPMFEIPAQTNIDLVISNSKASFTSTANGDSTVIKITAVQTLEKYWGLWIWNEVKDASWDKTANSSYISMSNSKSGLEGGKYRVKTVFTFTTSDGTTVSSTAYSEEKTV